MKNQRNTCLEKFKNQLSLLAILFLALPFIVVSCDAIEDIDPIATADEYEPNNQLAEHTRLLWTLSTTLRLVK